MIQNSTQVIPRGRIIRRKRNLVLGEALWGIAWGAVTRTKDIAIVAGQLSAPYSADTSDDGQKEDMNLRQFAPHSLLQVLARPSLRPILERDEEAMMPCRVVADVVRKESLDERQLTGPQVRLIKVGEEPLPVAPSMVVLRVCLEHLFVEC
jgi:hypothetical protein